MKKILTTIVAALVALSFSGIARAVPATDTMDRSISTLENEKEGATKPDQKQQAQKQQAQKGKKAKKAHKQQKGAKKAARPATTEAPAGPASTAAPATAPVSK
jgi:uncharacterized protein YxeA